MGPEYGDGLSELASMLMYPAGTCRHFQRPNIGDLRAPILSEIRETASSCLVCLVVSTVVCKILPELAVSEDATVWLDITESQERGSLCIAANADPTGKPCREEKLEVYSHVPTPVSLIPVKPRTPQRTDSDDHAIVAQIKAWMNGCVRHPGCPEESSVMPRRVLKISQDGNKVRLHLTRGEAAPYLTLSHCWGSTGPLQTTTANIGRHLYDIPVGTLPRLFLDAVTLTARLGYQYLWIDSLCIIQDSPGDWDRESSLMAAIYTHSILTIAASHAPSSASSLYSSQSSTAIEIASFTVHARLATKHLPRLPDPTTFPLLTRGWVYQERLLSRRVVHFGPDELAWECRSGIQCQCGYLDRADQRLLMFHDDRRGLDIKAQHTATLLRAAAMAKKHQDAPSPSPSPSPSQPPTTTTTTTTATATATTTATPQPTPYPSPPLLPAHWRKLVTAYSALSLTRASDRLPALSGLAKQVRRFRGARYLAGLWEDTFFRDALWLPVSDPGQRSAAWRAPTWSWASQRGAVRYTNGERMQLGGLGVYQPAEMGFNDGDVASELVGGSCELVAAECVAAGVDDTGRVEKAWVRVTGWVVEMEPVGEILGLEAEGWAVTVNGVESRRVFWDEEPKGVEEGGQFWGQRLCLLRIGCIPATGAGAPYDEWSLLLRRVGEGLFERCGIVNRYKPFRSKYDFSKLQDVHEYYEHTRETSPWFEKVKEAVVITIV